MKLKTFRTTNRSVKLDRPIGDSQVYYDAFSLEFLELITDDGLVGLGFQGERDGFSTGEGSRHFEVVEWKTLEGTHPAVHLNKILRLRGGNRHFAEFSVMTDIALWDLVSQAANMPLWRYLGGASPTVPVYASTLEFNLPDDEAVALIQQFRSKGFVNFKFKAGHKDLQRDLERLRQFQSLLERNSYFGVDANEAWCPADALKAISSYQQSGLKVAWIEDPCLRDDFQGLAKLSAQSPIPIVTGEYLDLNGKRQLLQSQAAGYLNVGGSISETRHCAQLAAAFGVPVHVGNSCFDINLNLAASLPEVKYAEFSDLALNRLLTSPYRSENGFIILNMTPGHGLRLRDWSNEA
ncbi:MAG: mandelate racemase/muconate lactonizing enzyme family protein [Acidobacteriota bacterium]